MNKERTNHWNERVGVDIRGHWKKVKVRYTGEDLHLEEADDRFKLSKTTIISKWGPT